MDWSTIDFTGVLNGITGNTGIITVIIPIALGIFSIVFAIKIIPKTINDWTETNYRDGDACNIDRSDEIWGGWHHDDSND